MKKLLTYVGTTDDETVMVSHGGVDFTKGVAVLVDTDETFPALFGNPTFVSEDVAEDEEVEHDDEAEREVLTERLVELKVKFRKNASIETLRKLVEDNEK